MKFRRSLLLPSSAQKIIILVCIRNMFENRVGGTSTDFTLRRSANHTSAKSVKKFVSGHSGFVSCFDEISIRDLHKFLSYVIFANIGTDQVFLPVRAYKNYTYAYNGKLHGILKVNNAWEIL